MGTLSAAPREMRRNAVALLPPMGAVLGLGLGLAAIAGCAMEETATAQGEVRAGERAILGAAVPYAPDRALDTKTDALARSQKARREAAWSALAKVLAEARLADDRVTLDEGGRRPTVPAFRTWYQKDDFERMFARVYEEHGAEARRARKPLDPAKIEAAFARNATDRGTLSEAQFVERMEQVTSEAQAQGLGGNARVSYSTGFVRHAMKNWAQLDRCQRGEIADAPDDDLLGTKNFTTCLAEEFPKDAAVIKASWMRANFGFTLPVRPTTPEALKERLDGSKDDGGWGAAVTTASPRADQIYGVEMTDGASFWMPALHLVTKELREWLWISLWWSPEPDTDFGADRPASIRALGGPWKHYKMCVVTAYEEKDPDPTGGFPTGPGSLGDALAAVHRAGGPSWCSNQYLERGEKNAQTNCIGCHQHAGTSLFSEDILADEERFPMSGRTKVRKNFPADYVFAVTAPPESLAEVIDTHVLHFDTIDAP